MAGAIAYADRDTSSASRVSASGSSTEPEADASAVTPTAATTPAAPAPTPTPTPTPPVPRDANGVPLAVISAVAAAGGDTAVAVFDATSGKTYAYHDSARFKTGSVAKLSILGETLRQQQNGRVLTKSDLSQMATMIENSSNDAASALWNKAGRGAAVIGKYDVAVGTKHTTANPQGYLGLTVTSATDQVAVMKAFAYPNAVLTDASRTQAAALLAKVEADQRFGATGGVPATATVLVKNGWLPYDVGWYVNTVAHVYGGGGKDYVVAIMSKGGASQDAGEDRLEKISAAVWQTAGVTP